jgi:beta-galactosidase
LRWTVVFKAGPNHLRVVAKTAAGKAITDEIDFQYQTEAWAKPAKLELKEMSRVGKTVTVLATLYDEQGVLCLDARNQVRFTLAGGGTLVDNLGTSTGSRVVQMYNGRAEISLQMAGVASVAVSSEGLATALCAVKA